MMRVLGYRPHCASVFDAAINCVSQPRVCQTHGASFQATFCCVGDDVVGVVDAINQNKSSRRTEHKPITECGAPILLSACLNNSPDGARPHHRFHMTRLLSVGMLGQAGLRRAGHKATGLWVGEEIFNQTCLNALFLLLPEFRGQQITVVL